MANRKQRRALVRLADEVTEQMFVNRFGHKADRLVLTGLQGQDLGGWCRQAVKDRILAALIKAAEAAGGEDHG